jgi:hypothetical protein
MQVNSTSASNHQHRCVCVLNFECMKCKPRTFKHAIAAACRCQLWGAALPINSPGVPAILDPKARVGVCGDWLTGAGLQSAYLSGLALADSLAALRGRDAAAAEELALGLRTPFQLLQESTIGEFPGVQGLAAEATAAAAAGGAGGRRQGGGGGREGGRGGRGRGRGQGQGRGGEQVALTAAAAGASRGR